MSDKKPNNIFDMAIIGTGAAGLAAAVYAGRYKLNVVSIGHEFGGDTATAGSIENYPGFMAIDGFDLMDKMKKQAEAFGVTIIAKKIATAKRTKHCFELSTNDETYNAHELIFAVGTERRKLGLPNEKELTGKGVHYCVTCDGPVYNGKTIALVGGGDASVKGINLAAEYVKKAYLIVRGNELAAEPANLEQFKKLGDKVETLLETEVKEIIGKDRLEKIKLSKPFNGSDELMVDGLFVEIGAIPNTELAKQLGVTLDEKGYIAVDSMMKTNVDGVFAAGDTTNFFGSFKQDITAAAQGAVAATSAYQDKKIHGDLCPLHMVPSKKETFNL